MGKAILVIDVDDIDIENTQVTYIELECQNYTEGMSLINHWLKPLPCKKEVKEIKHFEDVVTIKTQYDLIEDKIVGKIKYDTETIFNEGYNSCLDEILGETEE